LRARKSGDDVSVRRVGRDALALASLAAAVAAGTLAVLSALGASSPGVSPAQAAAPELTSRSVAFGHDGVVVHVRPNGSACFRLRRGSSTIARSCVAGLGASEISYASSPHAIGGVAGSQVRAVIVRLTRQGTVWATLRRGTFYAALPAGYAARAVVKVLAGGARRTFTVTGSR
jgi:hypothetical protein